MLLSIDNRVIVTLPEQWDYDVRDTNTALYRSQDGRGAVSISTLKQSTHGLPIKSLLELFTGTATDNVVIVDRDNCEVAFSESFKENRYWKHWVLRLSQIAVFVSYNCRRDQANSREMEEVAQIIDSISERSTS